MTLLNRLSLAVLHRFDPETAHGLAIRALRSGLVPAPGTLTSARLATSVAGLALNNPVGLAAGFDKNAIAIKALSQSGFGFVEYGAVTPRPQPGNPRPRLFRLTPDQAAINRFGFNNEGATAVAARLAGVTGRATGGMIRGINLGANKDSADMTGDFAAVLRLCGPHVDFATVNVSSPNTAGLRALQTGDHLRTIFERVAEVRDSLPVPIPIFLKIAPDLDPQALAAMAEAALALKVDALICTNTTLARDGLHSAHRDEAGGLSGQPLFERSTRILAQVSKLTDGRLPLIGVGGIGSAEQAYAKIRAGASALQLYTALVYQGMDLVPRIVRGLDDLLAQDGFASVADAVGTGREDWL